MKKKNPSQLRAYIALTLYAFKASIRNKSTLFFSLFFPVVFIIALGMIGNSGLSVKVGIPDNQPQNPITPVIQNISTVKIQKGTKLYLEGELQKGKLDAIVNVKQTESGYNVSLTTSNANPSTSAAAQSILRGLVDQVNLKIANVTDPPVKLVNTEVSGRKNRYVDFVLPGQIGFSLLSTALFGTVFGFIALRRLLVFKRMFVTPTKPIVILLSQASSRLIMALIQTTIILAVGVFFFQFYLPHGFLTFLELLVISALGLISFLGFGFFMSGLASDENSAGPLVQLVSLPQMLLSGVFFSTDLLPKWIQPVANNLPLTYFNESVRTVTIEGGTLIDALPYLVGFIAWGVVMYLLSIKTFKWE